MRPSSRMIAALAATSEDEIAFMATTIWANGSLLSGRKRSFLVRWSSRVRRLGGSAAPT